MLVGKKRTILGNCRWRISPEGCLRFHSGTRPSSKRTSNHLHVISAPLERKILPHGSGTIAPASHHSSSDGTFTPLMMAEELLPFLRCFHNPGKRFNLDLIVLRKGSFWAINERPSTAPPDPQVIRRRRMTMNCGAARTHRRRCLIPEELKENHFQKKCRLIDCH